MIFFLLHSTITLTLKHYQNELIGDIEVEHMHHSADTVADLVHNDYVAVLQLGRYLKRRQEPQEDNAVDQLVEVAVAPELEAPHFVAVELVD